MTRWTVSTVPECGGGATDAIVAVVPEVEGTGHVGSREFAIERHIVQG